MELANKLAFITGASQGIGQGIAQKLAANGASVVIADIQFDKAVSTAKEIDPEGRKAIALKMDVTSSQSVKAAFEDARKRMGNIDILVNVAGVAIASKIENLSEEIWDRTFNINIKGTFLCCQAYMNGEKRDGGRIINISSMAAKIGEYGNGAYCASKAAVSMLTQVLALEAAEYGITVNAVCPGMVDTELMDVAFGKLAREANMTVEEYKAIRNNAVPLGRMAKVDDVAELVAFLASPKSSYITGVAYTIAGGATLI